MTLYHVRQYHPNFFEGFENTVVHNVSYEDILKPLWFRNFEHHDFHRFEIAPYGNGELIISAHYRSGEQWVAGFAIDTSHELANNWRYHPQSKEDK
jgi:hypothetical protein